MKGSNLSEVSNRLLLDPVPLLAAPTSALERALSTALAGARVLKVGRSGRPLRRLVRIAPALDAVTYESRRKRPEDCTFLFADSVRVQRGLRSSSFGRLGGGGSALAEAKGLAEASARSLSVVLASGRTLDLLFIGCEAGVGDRVAGRSAELPSSGQDEALFQAFYICLHALLVRAHTGFACVSERSLFNFFNCVDGSTTCETSDPTKDGRIVQHVSYETASLFLSQLRILPPESLSNESACHDTTLFIMKIAPIELDGPSSPFGNKLATLTCSDNAGDVLIPASAIRSFLRVDQGLPSALLEDARLFCSLLDPSHDVDFVSSSAFTSYLTGSSNSAFAPECASLGCGASVEDYMSHPLSDYWICSSHNTYLEGDQLQGSSSVGAYLSALQMGCRCVELDCWDGPQGEPTVYHGHTLTQHVRFGDIVSALAETAFLASPFPLILSLEVHCSARQQDRMAEILRTEFGERLVFSTTEETESIAASVFVPDKQPFQLLPSPAALRGRVIVKAKLKRLQSRSSGLSTPFLAPPANQNLSPDEQALRRSPVTLASLAEGVRFKLAGVSTKPSHPQPVGSLTPPTRPGTPTYPELPRVLSHALYSSVRLLTVKWASDAHISPPWTMSSLKEHKAAHLLQGPDGASLVLERTRSRLVRVYPGAIRVDSSNFNPAPHWAAGVQMAALNVQTAGVAMHINRAMFRQNGNCGFVLKPQRLRAAALRAAAPFSSVHLPSDTNKSGRYPASSIHREVGEPEPDSEELVQWLLTCGGRCAPLLLERMSLNKVDNFLQTMPSSLLCGRFVDKPTVLSVSVLGVLSLGTVLRFIPPHPPQSSLESATRDQNSNPISCAISVLGDPGDCTRVHTRSVTMLGAGRSAFGGEKLDFTLKHADVAFLYLSIHLDSDPNLVAGLDGWSLPPASGIAHFAAPVSCLRGGLRNCPLSDPSGREIPQAGLLCRFSAREVG
jgi:hypothetical protein